MRPLRPDFTNTFHHIVIRGIDGLPIFDTPEKREKFLQILKETKETHDLKIYAFGFLDNHWHAFVRRENRSMARFFQTVKSRYTRWYNSREGRSGTLYDDRYFSSIVEADNYFQMVWQYVQSQGVSAGLYETPESDPGSTAGLYAGVDDRYKWIDWEEALQQLDLPKETLGEKIRIRYQEMKNPDKLPRKRKRDQNFIASDSYIEKYMQIRKTTVRNSDRKESPVSWEFLLWGCEELFDVEKEIVLEPSKKSELVKFRSGLAYAARRYGHKTTTEIASRLDVSNGTVSRMIKRVRKEFNDLKIKWDEWIQYQNQAEKTKNEMSDTE